MRTFAYKGRQRCKEVEWNGKAHPFEITMRDPEFVKVGHARGYFR